MPQFVALMTSQRDSSFAPSQQTLALPLRNAIMSRIDVLQILVKFNRVKFSSPSDSVPRAFQTQRECAVACRAKSTKTSVPDRLRLFPDPPSTMVHAISQRKIQCETQQTKPYPFPNLVARTISKLLHLDPSSQASPAESVVSPKRCQHVPSFRYSAPSHSSQ